MRAQATLFRESQEAREAVRSNGSLIHLGDNPEYADIVSSPAIERAVARLRRNRRALDGRIPDLEAGWRTAFILAPGLVGLGRSKPATKVRAQQLFVMIYLTDTTPENGCLRVIPGSHLAEHPLHHLESAHSEDMQGYSDPSNPAYADHPDQFAVPVKAGDILVGDARLIHGAFANRSSEERPLLTLWYMPHWSHMPAPMRALAYKGFMRGDDIRASVARPATALDWPEPIRGRVEHLLPPDDGGVPPMRWNRTPDFAKLAA